VGTAGSCDAAVLFSLRITIEDEAVPAWLATVRTGGPTVTHELCATASTWP